MIARIREWFIRRRLRRAVHLLNERTLDLATAEMEKRIEWLTIRR